MRRWHEESMRGDKINKGQREKKSRRGGEKMREDKQKAMRRRGVEAGRNDRGIKEMR